jgi:hypothetical protein
VSPPPPIAAPSTQASHTFDRVDFARRRIAELLRESRSVPSLMALADRMARTASHSWCLWVTPRPKLPALLISGEWNLSAFVLQGFYSRVEVWETDAHRAEITARVADEADLNIHVQQCPPTQLADRLRSVGQPYALAAIQDALGLIPRRSRALRREVLHHLAAITSADGQCCVISRNRFAPAVISGGFGSDYAPPTPAEVMRGWAAAGKEHIQTLFFHPDHHDPGEVLFPPERLPRARRDQKLPRILKHLGIFERILGSFASFLPMQRGPLLVDQAAEHWQRGTSAGGFERVLDCTVREGAMVFVTMSLAAGGAAIVRIPLLREATDALVRLDDAYMETARSLPHVQRLIPESRPLFNVHGWPVHVERKCEGQPIRSLIGNPDARTKIRTQILEFVNGLCGATLERRTVDDDFAEAHYRTRVRSICASEPALAPHLARVETAVLERAHGTAMPTVRIHGDLTVNNVFADPATGVLSGVIDWETSLAGSLPFDFIHYLISERRESDPQPWGVMVARALAGNLFDAEAEALLNNHLAFLGLAREQLRPLLIGYWVRGVALRQLLSGGRLAPTWRQQNLAGPLASISQTLLA